MQPLHIALFFVTLVATIISMAILIGLTGRPETRHTSFSMDGATWLWLACGFALMVQIFLILVSAPVTWNNLPQKLFGILVCWPLLIAVRNCTELLAGTLRHQYRKVPRQSMMRKAGIWPTAAVIAVAFFSRPLGYDLFWLGWVAYGIYFFRRGRISTSKRSPRISRRNRRRGNQSSPPGRKRS